MIQLRPYQQEAIDAVLAYWREGGQNPLVDLATGLGKSVVIAKLTRDLLAAYPDMRVLNLVHVRELVQQNFQAMLRLWPGAPIGIYSAGLGRRDRFKQILFASIQSVYRQDHFSLGAYDLVLIDEAHLVPSAGDGMYRVFLEKLRRATPDLRVAGFTATPFRLGTGSLTDGGKNGEPPLFNEIVYSYGVGPGIRDGWLSPLISKASLVDIDLSGVKRSGGEFVGAQLEQAVDQDPITQAAVTEIMGYGQDRRSWLVFCAGVDHAHHVRDAIRARGVSCETITGDTDSGARARHIADFKAGRLRCLTNANVLTTGFDAPATDLVAMLRPTLSPGLYVQMVGRGTRKADGKDNCLVLDFAGNVSRHGPVDMVEIKRKGGGGGEAPTKVCPDCMSICHAAVRECPDCGFAFPVPEEPKHEARAFRGPILSTETVKPDDQPVVSWSAARHSKPGSPDSLKVTYFAGLLSYPEWVCFEHTGYAREKAERWWSKHGGAMPAPRTVADAMGRWGELRAPATIQTRQNGKWFEIVGRRFNPPASEAAA